MSTVERMLQQFILITGLVIGGCFAPLPIEETPEPKDESVTIERSEVRPRIDEVVVLSLDGTGDDLIFETGPLTDPNLEQALFLRVVFDLGDGGISVGSGNANREISPLDRANQGVRFRPCNSPIRPSIEQSFLRPEIQQRFKLYIAISDAPFSEPPTNIFSPLTDFLATEGERPIQLLSWDLEFTVTDPQEICSTSN